MRRLWLAIVATAVIAALCVTACAPTGQENAGGAFKYNVWVDSTRHVACYNRAWSDPLSCVALDSTNSHAIGGEHGK